MKKPSPRLCIVGPLVGRTPGYITTPGEILADLFRDAGYPMVAVSYSTNRYHRLLDIVTTLLRERRKLDLLILMIYGGRSFVVEDAASWIARREGVPIVMALHGGTIPKLIGRFPIWSERVFRRAAHLVTPSEYLARCVRRYGIPTQVIPNLIDISAYPYRHRSFVKPRMLWMRSFHSMYNPEMAIRVLTRVRSQRPDATLVMAGRDKGLQSKVEMLARDLGVGEAVRFPGFLDMEGKRREGEAADIFINTNRIDNQPVGVLEAAAMGLPIISTAVGGIPDMLEHNETGFLVPDGDEEAMAAAVLTLVASPSLSSRLSRNGRPLAERSAVQSIFPRWVSIVGALADQGPA